MMLSAIYTPETLVQILISIVDVFHHATLALCAFTGVGTLARQ